MGCDVGILYAEMLGLILGELVVTISKAQLVC
jgi:tetrahydromethanopterin S-methyltransferase subunit G